MDAHAIILTSNTYGIECLTTLGITRSFPNPDTILVEPLEDKRSISIEQVHTLQERLSYKPFQEEMTIAIIAPAHTLTVPAQQALLKTLEEPAAHTQLILVTPFTDRLLPTIRSRCVIIQSNKDNTTENKAGEQTYHVWTSASITQCIQEAEALAKEKGTTLEKLYAVLASVREQTHRAPTAAMLTHEKIIIKTIERIEANVNARIALEHMLFTIAGHIK